MRELRAKFEYLINCQCGKRYLYDKYDLTNNIKCQCGQMHNLDGSHETHMLEKVRVYEYSEKPPAPPALTEAP